MRIKLFEFGSSIILRRAFKLIILNVSTSSKIMNLLSFIIDDLSKLFFKFRMSSTFIFLKAAPFK